MKIFKVVAINLYGSINENQEIKGFEQWEEEIKANSKEELKEMLSNNNQVISIEEIDYNNKSLFELITDIKDK